MPYRGQRNENDLYYSSESIYRKIDLQTEDVEDEKEDLLAEDLKAKK
jgi:hypothetical protein